MKDIEVEGLVNNQASIFAHLKVHLAKAMCRVNDLQIFQHACRDVGIKRSFSN
jgi:hypothetical protein